MSYEIMAKFLIAIVSVNCASCAIDGSFRPNPENLTRPGEDPCNSLYWYPRGIPEYCYYTATIKPRSIIRPVPMPIPVPLPSQPFYPPIYPPLAMPVMHPVPSSPGEGPQAMPYPVMAPPLPFGIPLTPIIPVDRVQYNPFQPPYPMPPPPMPMPSISQTIPQYQIGIAPQSQIGMIPGLPGMVSYDGGINIMPFSDAYADLLEKHKQKMIRRRLQKFLDEYDRYPWKSQKKE